MAPDDYSERHEWDIKEPIERSTMLDAESTLNDVLNGHVIVGSDAVVWYSDDVVPALDPVEQSVEEVLDGHSVKYYDGDDF